MDGMTYEYLIRMANNSGRGYSNGADADIYREMEREYLAWQKEGKGVLDDTDQHYKYRVAAAKVKSNILAAINKGQTQINNEQDIDSLSSLKGKLHIHEYSRDLIDRVLKEAFEIFRKNNLEAK